MAIDPSAEDIAAWQSDWNLPRTVLEEVVRRAVGSPIASDVRLLEGHGNEVHLVTTTAGFDVVVRAAWRAGSTFEDEPWPMLAARQAGLPTPEVFAVERVDVDGREVSVQVQERMPGRPVHRLLPSLADDDVAALSRAAGRLLAALHAVEAPGHDDHRGPVAAAVVEAMAGRTPSLIDAGLDAALLAAAVDTVAGASAVLDAAPVRLTHGDWRTSNLLSDGHTITGVVDWDGAGAGDPTLDFVVWPVPSRPHATSHTVLMDGYREAGGVFDGGFEHRLLVLHIADLHSALSHFTFTARPDLLQRALVDLRAALRQANA